MSSPKSHNTGFRGGKPPQPVFSRKGAPQVEDQRLVKRSLNLVAESKGTEIPNLPNVSTVNSCEHVPVEKTEPSLDGEGNVVPPPKDVLAPPDPSELAKKKKKDLPPEPIPDSEEQRQGNAAMNAINEPEMRQYSRTLVGVGPHLEHFLDRDFLESAISTYNRLAEYARNKKQYNVGINHLKRALMLEIPPDDWPLRILIAKTQVNVATMHYLLGSHHESLLEATLARDRSLDCLNYLDSEAFSVKKGLEDPDLLFLLEESAVTFCLALHSAALAMKQLPGVEPDSIVEVDRLAWKIASKYLDRGHPCGKFLLKAFENRGTLAPSETRLSHDDQEVSAAAQFKIKKKLVTIIGDSLKPGVSRE